MRSRAAHVESCTQEVQEIYEAVETLAQSQDKALLDTFGIECNSSSESTGEETDCSSLYDSFSDPNTTSVHLPDPSSLTISLCESDFNWFQFCACMMEESNDLDVCSTLEDFFLQISHLRFGQSLQYSHIVLL